MISNLCDSRRFQQGTASACTTDPPILKSHKIYYGTYGYAARCRSSVELSIHSLVLAPRTLRKNIFRPTDFPPAPRALKSCHRRGRDAMPNYDGLFNAFLTILVTIDPPGLAPLFLALTRGMNRDERTQVSIRASIIAFGVMALFALGRMRRSCRSSASPLPAFRVAGGSAAVSSSPSR